MRVIAGTARGTRLKAPKGLSVRPTSDRVKEALFSILGQRIIGAFFIDLYAGSGAIGIEALSRGARFCIFVDNKSENTKLIRDNLTRTRLAYNSRVLLADAQKIVPGFVAESVKADLLYLDPPYDYSGLSSLTDLILKNKLVSDDGMLIVEHASANQQWIRDFASIRQKKYGDTCLTFIQPA